MSHKITVDGYTVLASSSVPGGAIPSTDHSDAPLRENENASCNSARSGPFSSPGRSTRRPSLITHIWRRHRLGLRSLMHLLHAHRQHDGRQRQLGAAASL